MGYWGLDEALLNHHDLTVMIESRRRVSIAENDQAIFFKRAFSNIEFISYGRVSSIVIQDLESGIFRFKAAIDGVSIFDHARSLEDFAYSLLKVYRYAVPTRHFRRSYLRLEESDFNALVNAQIFWSRTAFGSFINQLPRMMQMRFMVKLAELQPRVLIERAGYNLIWQVLRDFIKEEYVAAARIFIEIRRQVEELETSQEGKLRFEELFFSSDDPDDRPNSISKQEGLFTKFFEALTAEEEPISLLEQLDAKVEHEESTEQEFEKTFRGKPWPVQMM